MIMEFIIGRNAGIAFTQGPIIRVFRPARVTSCTDLSQIWYGAKSPNFVKIGRSCGFWGWNFAKL